MPGRDTSGTGQLPGGQEVTAVIDTYPQPFLLQKFLWFTISKLLRVHALGFIRICKV